MLPIKEFDIDDWFVYQNSQPRTSTEIALINVMIKKDVMSFKKGDQYPQVIVDFHWEYVLIGEKALFFRDFQDDVENLIKDLDRQCNVGDSDLPSRD